MPQRVLPHNFNNLDIFYARAFMYFLLFIKYLYNTTAQISETKNILGLKNWPSSNPIQN